MGVPTDGQQKKEGRTDCANLGLGMDMARFRLRPVLSAAQDETREAICCGSQGCCLKNCLAVLRCLGCWARHDLCRMKTSLGFGESGSEWRLQTRAGPRRRMLGGGKVAHESGRSARHQLCNSSELLNISMLCAFPLQNRANDTNFTDS